MGWLKRTVEQAREPITIDVRGVPGLVDAEGRQLQTLQIIPVSARTYASLKSHPRLRSLVHSDDRAEVLAQLVVFESLKQADPSLSEEEFFRLPMGTLLQLGLAVARALGTSSLEGGVGGVLGESNSGANQTAA